MIIWINGPYGVGKSALTEALQGRLKACFIFDAERLGDAIRENMPEPFFRETFEEYPLWLETCGSLLEELAQIYEGYVLIPMTLLCPESAQAIFDRLRTQQVATIHVMLEASHETVRQRILTRGEEEDCWCMAQIDRCLEAQRQMNCDHRLWTVGKTPEVLAQELMDILGIEDTAQEHANSTKGENTEAQDTNQRKTTTQGGKNAGTDFTKAHGD